MKSTIIVLQTDFGLKDSYVGTMKGRMLSICRRLTFIDLVHTIEPFNIASACYHLYSAWNYFPKRSVFLSIVDPGVGSSRNVLIARFNDRFLVSPDNGTVSLLMRMFPDYSIFSPDKQLLDSLSHTASQTFHGRDIFSPLAALIACHGFNKVKGKQCEPVVLKEVFPLIDTKSKRVTGNIMHIDRFGNCISSIHTSDVDKTGGTADKAITFSGTVINSFSHAFSDVKPGKPLVYTGSAGFFEIGVREGNASEIFRLKQGDKIVIEECLK
jgi:S-adenosylmethionine hydrolase